MDGLFETALKWIAGGGSLTALQLIWHILKIEPRLKSLEMTILRGQKIKLLELAIQAGKNPVLHADAMEMFAEVETAMKGDANAS